MKKTLILYLYREDAKTIRNLDFFLKNALLASEIYTYLFIINDHKCSLDIPSLPNIKILKKENSFDLCAYKQALDFIGDSFDFFIFINSSCVGPLVPAYENKEWPDLFTSLINEKVKLVGPVVEIPKDSYGASCLNEHKYITESQSSVPFIHTFMFATDKTGLQVLQKYDVFLENSISRFELIHVYERLISSSFLNEGFKIKSLLYKFKNIDLSDKKNWNYKLWSKSHITDPEIPSNYDGIDLHPFELIFFKNIRYRHSFRSWRASGLSSTSKKLIKRYLSWS